MEPRKHRIDSADLSPEWTEAQRLACIQDIIMRLLDNSDNMTPRQTRNILLKIHGLTHRSAADLETERDILIALS
jgi:hypothetical protein